MKHMKIKKLHLFIVFINTILIFVSVSTINIKADELNVVPVRTNISIKANVPDDFSDNVTVVLEQKSTNVKFSLALTKSNSYTGNLSVVGDSTYNANAIFQNTSSFKTDLAENYEIKGTEVNLTFNIRKLTAVSNTDKTENTSKDSLSNQSHNDANNSTDANKTIKPNGKSEENFQNILDKEENVINHYIEQVSFIQNDTNYTSFLSSYSGAMFQKYFLKADPLNTDEKWNSMTDFEKFNYYILYIMPYSKMMNYTYDSESNYVEELVSQKNILSQLEKGDAVYNAITEVWSWLFKYWQDTGDFCNLFKDYDYTSIKTDEASNTVVLEGNDTGSPSPTLLTTPTPSVVAQNDKDSSVNSNTVKAMSRTEKKKNMLLDLVKNNAVTLVILLAAIIVLIVIIIKNKKNNYY